MDAGETRVAVLEGKGTARSGGKPRPSSDRGARGRGAEQAARDGGDFKVAELYVERRGQRSIVGNVYKGVVDNVLPGMEAAFVDIGLDRNGFLHVDEIVLPGGEAAPRRGRGRGRRIDELLKPKQEVLVQVVKDPLKTKGARLSMQLSIAGRYLVYMPSGGGVGASRRLSDAERDRQRKLLQKIHRGPGGVIIRTAAQGARKADFERDIEYLKKLDEVVQRRSNEVKAPEMVFQEADLSIRVLRDVLEKEFDGAIIDDEKQHHRVTSFFQRTAPELVKHVELYEGKEPLFEKMGVEEAYRSVLSRRVDLPSGGYLMIDYAEALTVIDVNTGSFTGRGKGRLEDTITRVNVEAADEVVRQLRLRDIGGIIVIDFIDMARARNREQVLKTLRKSLDADKTKSYVMDVSPLGLVEMTRQNVTDGVREILTKRCPTCEGEGVVESEETVAISVVRRLRDLIDERPDPEAFLVRVNPKVAAELLREESPLHELEEDSGKHFHFEGGDALSLDTFEVVDSGTRAEIEERALPFQVGDEVLVRIEEPHMYNVDDAVARVDSYIVSVTGAGRFVGDRRLVRIESVGRAAATASLVGGAEEDNGNGADDAEGGSPNGDPVESSSSRRRRGRRGGRRRSRAQAQNPSNGD
ncbi:MAG TPA: Rne/Rng family ribonuclease [Solirubrobacterales bacterium]|nr:Rne/Rng family ribonuclease [Solirubrobacterales bacterium]